MTHALSRCMATLLAAGLAACSVGPPYQRPSTPAPAGFKEAPVDAGATWLPAAPADALDRGDWWRLFGDDELNRLAALADANNQTVAQSVASYRQAQAVVREARASLFPSLSAGVTASRSGGSRTSGSSFGGSSGPVNSFGLSAQGDWQPDLWGRLGLGVTQARASAEASAADLAAARLSAQGELAIDYFSLREADAEAALIATTIEGYERAQQITQNRYTAGIVAKTDVLQAQTTLYNARADLAGVRENRARFEHAIAVLTGQAPEDFSLPWRRGSKSCRACRSACLRPCCNAAPTSPPTSAPSPPPMPRSASSDRPTSRT